jgi:hypothetical protein
MLAASGRTQALTGLSRPGGTLARDRCARVSGDASPRAEGAAEVASMQSDRPCPQLLDKIEQATGIDRTAEAIQRAVSSLLGNRSVRRVLSGPPIGHPLHPALVAVPIGSWLSASMLDLTAGNRASARRLIGFGCLSSLLHSH